MFDFQGSCVLRRMNSDAATNRYGAPTPSSNGRPVSRASEGVFCCLAKRARGRGVTGDQRKRLRAAGTCLSLSRAEHVISINRQRMPTARAYWYYSWDLARKLICRIGGMCVLLRAEHALGRDNLTSHGRNEVGDKEQGAWRRSQAASPLTPGHPLRNVAIPQACLTVDQKSGMPNSQDWA